MRLDSWFIKISLIRFQIINQQLPMLLLIVQFIDPVNFVLSRLQELLRVRWVAFDVQSVVLNL